MGIMIDLIVIKNWLIDRVDRLTNGDHNSPDCHKNWLIDRVDRLTNADHDQIDRC